MLGNCVPTNISGNYLIVNWLCTRDYNSYNNIVTYIGDRKLKSINYRFKLIYLLWIKYSILNITSDYTHNIKLLHKCEIVDTRSVYKFIQNDAKRHTETIIRYKKINSEVDVTPSAQPLTKKGRELEAKPFYWAPFYTSHTSPFVGASFWIRGKAFTER